MHPQFSVTRGVCAARYHASGVVAVGGREHDVAVWDVERSVAVFQARNVANTMLDLRVPIWVSALAFLPEAGVATGGPANVLAAATGYRHVRVYDVRSGRRPVGSADIGEHPFTALEPTACDGGRSILTGDASGAMRRIDVGTLRQIAGYDGAGGSVRSITCHATLPYFASASLDRSLRIHHVETRALLRRVYLKQRLTAAAFVPRLPDSGNRPAVAVDKAGHGRKAARARDSDGEEEARDTEVDTEIIEPDAPRNAGYFTRAITSASVAPRASDPRYALPAGPRVEPSAAIGAAAAADVWDELDRRAAEDRRTARGVRADDDAPASGGVHDEDSDDDEERSDVDEYADAGVGDDDDGASEIDDLSSSESDAVDAREDAAAALVDSKAVGRALMREVDSKRRQDAHERGRLAAAGASKKARR